MTCYLVCSESICFLELLTEIIVFIRSLDSDQSVLVLLFWSPCEWSVSLSQVALIASLVFADMLLQAFITL